MHANAKLRLHGLKSHLLWLPAVKIYASWVHVQFIRPGSQLGGRNNFKMMLQSQIFYCNLNQKRKRCVIAQLIEPLIKFWFRKTFSTFGNPTVHAIKIASSSAILKPSSQTKIESCWSPPGGRLPSSETDEKFILPGSALSWAPCKASLNLL